LFAFLDMYNSDYSSAILSNLDKSDIACCLLAYANLVQLFIINHILQKNSLIFANIKLITNQSKYFNFNS